MVLKKNNYISLTKLDDVAIFAYVLKRKTGNSSKGHESPVGKSFFSISANVKFFRH